MAIPCSPSRRACPNDTGRALAGAALPVTAGPKGEPALAETVGEHIVLSRRDAPGQ